MPYCVRCGYQFDQVSTKCPRCGERVDPSFVAFDHMPSGTILKYRRRKSPRSEFTFTFLEGSRVLAEVAIPVDGDTRKTFGREGCDILVQPTVRTVSAKHGAIRVHNGQCYVDDTNSSNGLYFNGVRRDTIRVVPEDVIIVGPPRQGETRTVILVGDDSMTKTIYDLKPKTDVTIGRAPDNEIVIKDPTVSSAHARLVRTDKSKWAIIDCGSYNGTQVNGCFLSPGKAEPLTSGSIITLGNARVVFLDTGLLLFGERAGVDVQCEGLVRRRKVKGKTVVTNDHISLHIKRGEFVAVVGGSGSGKSTLLNELNGSEPADEGSVAIDGTDLYANYSQLKTSIGYVPQQDIVYDNLTLESMLVSAARLRMTPDTTAEERMARVKEIIHLLELDGVRNNMIGRLSGGQKKRASIAVELLADPRLLFLDEPTSGLDPGIERKLMQTLSEMAKDGRTIILVTHTTLNLHLCDQVIFLGYGGKLCFAGRPDEAKEFFGVDDLVDVYNKIADDPGDWQRKFSLSKEDRAEPATTAATGERPTKPRKMPSLFSQFQTLSKRYAQLIFNNRSRLLLMLGQGPLLALVIGLVASKDCFAVYEKGKSCLFALSCAAFWLGIFNSIQEVCKERDIFQREYGGGVRIGSYVASKVVILGGLCILQSAMLSAVFFLVAAAMGHGRPGPGALVPTGEVEVFITLTLLTLSSMCLGLLVSALFDNPDKAIAMAPLLIMPQILFAGVVFKLEGNANLMSYAVNCRWGMEALGTSLDLDSRDLSLYGEQITIPSQEHTEHDITIDPDEIGEIEVDDGFGGTISTRVDEPITIDEKTFEVPESQTTIDGDMLAHDPNDLDNNMFTRTLDHLMRAWGVLVGFCLLCIAGCHALLARSVKR